RRGQGGRGDETREGPRGQPHDQRVTVKDLLFLRLPN
ncbi:MAG: hypothetical protein JWN91_3884, partial [Nocardioides sp.]|nr:hypothetical protein [Nocardioides sp.]